MKASILLTIAAAGLAFAQQAPTPPSLEDLLKDLDKINDSIIPPNACSLEGFSFGPKASPDSFNQALFKSNDACKNLFGAVCSAKNKPTMARYARLQYDTDDLDSRAKIAAIQVYKKDAAGQIDNAATKKAKEAASRLLAQYIKERAAPPKKPAPVKKGSAPVPPAQNFLEYLSQRSSAGDLSALAALPAYSNVVNDMAENHVPKAYSEAIDAAFDKGYDNALAAFNNTKRRMIRVLQEAEAGAARALEASNEHHKVGKNRAFIAETFAKMREAVSAVSLAPKGEAQQSCIKGQRNAFISRQAPSSDSSAAPMVVVVCPASLISSDANQPELAGMFAKMLGHAIDGCAMDQMHIGSSPSGETVPLGALLDPLRECLGQGISENLKSNNPPFLKRVELAHVLDDAAYKDELYNQNPGLTSNKNYPHCTKQTTAGDLRQPESSQQHQSNDNDALAQFWANKALAGWLSNEGRKIIRPGKDILFEALSPYCDAVPDPKSYLVDPAAMLNVVVARDPDLRKAVASSLRCQNVNEQVLINENAKALGDADLPYATLAKRPSTGLCDPQLEAGLGRYLKELKYSNHTFVPIEESKSKFGGGATPKDNEKVSAKTLPALPPLPAKIDEPTVTANANKGPAAPPAEPAVVETPPASPKQTHAAGEAQWPTASTAGVAGGSAITDYSKATDKELADRRASIEVALDQARADCRAIYDTGFPFDNEVDLVQRGCSNDPKAHIDIDMYKPNIPGQPSSRFAGPREITVGGYAFNVGCQSRCNCGMEMCGWPEPVYLGQVNDPKPPAVSPTPATLKSDIDFYTAFDEDNKRYSKGAKACFLKGPDRGNSDYKAGCSQGGNAATTIEGTHFTAIGETSGTLLDFGCRFFCECENGKPNGMCTADVIPPKIPPMPPQATAAQIAEAMDFKPRTAVEMLGKNIYLIPHGMDIAIGSKEGGWSGVAGGGRKASKFLHNGNAATPGASRAAATSGLPSPFASNPASNTANSSIVPYPAEAYELKPRGSAPEEACQNEDRRAYYASRRIDRDIHYRQALRECSRTTTALGPNVCPNGSKGASLLESQQQLIQYEGRKLQGMDIPFTFIFRCSYDCKTQQPYVQYVRETPAYSFENINPIANDDYKCAMEADWNSANNISVGDHIAHPLDQECAAYMAPSFNRKKEVMLETNPNRRLTLEQFRINVSSACHDESQSGKQADHVFQDLQFNPEHIAPNMGEITRSHLRYRCEYTCPCEDFRATNDNGTALSPDQIKAYPLQCKAKAIPLGLTLPDLRMSDYDKIHPVEEMRRSSRPATPTEVSANKESVMGICLYDPAVMPSRQCTEQDSQNDKSVIKEVSLPMGAELVRYQCTYDCRYRKDLGKWLYTPKVSSPRVTSAISGRPSLSIQQSANPTSVPAARGQRNTLGEERSEEHSAASDNAQCPAAGSTWTPNDFNAVDFKANYGSNATCRSGGINAGTFRVRFSKNESCDYICQCSKSANGPFNCWLNDAQADATVDARPRAVAPKPEPIASTLAPPRSASPAKAQRRKPPQASRQSVATDNNIAVEQNANPAKQPAAPRPTATPPSSSPSSTTPPPAPPSKDKQSSTDQKAPPSSPRRTDFDGILRDYARFQKDQAEALKKIPSEKNPASLCSSNMDQSRKDQLVQQLKITSTTCDKDSTDKAPPKGARAMEGKMLDFPSDPSAHAMDGFCAAYFKGCSPENKPIVSYSPIIRSYGENGCYDFLAAGDFKSGPKKASNQSCSSLTGKETFSFSAPNRAGSRNGEQCSYSCTCEANPRCVLFHEEDFGRPDATVEFTVNTPAQEQTPALVTAHMHAHAQAQANVVVQDKEKEQNVEPAKQPAAAHQAATLPAPSSSAAMPSSRRTDFDGIAKDYARFQKDQAEVLKELPPEENLCSNMDQRRKDQLMQQLKITSTTCGKNSPDQAPPKGAKAMEKTLDLAPDSSVHAMDGFCAASFKGCSSANKPIISYNPIVRSYSENGCYDSINLDDLGEEPRKAAKQSCSSLKNKETFSFNAPNRAGSENGEQCSYSCTCEANPRCVLLHDEAKGQAQTDAKVVVQDKKKEPEKTQTPPPAAAAKSSLDSSDKITEQKTGQILQPPRAQSVAATPPAPAKPKPKQEQPKPAPQPVQKSSPPLSLGFDAVVSSYAKLEKNQAAVLKALNAKGDKSVCSTIDQARKDKILKQLQVTPDMCSEKDAKEQKARAAVDKRVLSFGTDSSGHPLEGHCAGYFKGCSTAEKVPMVSYLSIDARSYNKYGCYDFISTRDFTGGPKKMAQTACESLKDKKTFSYVASNRKEFFEAKEGKVVIDDSCTYSCTCEESPRCVLVQPK